MLKLYKKLSINQIVILILTILLCFIVHELHFNINRQSKKFTKSLSLESKRIQILINSRFSNIAKKAELIKDGLLTKKGTYKTEFYSYKNMHDIKSIFVISGHNNRVEYITQSHASREAIAFSRKKILQGNFYYIGNNSLIYIEKIGRKKLVIEFTLNKMIKMFESSQEFASGKSFASLNAILISKHNQLALSGSSAYYKEIASNIKHNNITIVNLWPSYLNYSIFKMADTNFSLLLYYNKDYLIDNTIYHINSHLLSPLVVSVLIFILMIIIAQKERYLRICAEKASANAVRTASARIDFMSITAHEVRSPLQVILSTAHIMNSRMLGEIDDKYTEYIQAIESNTNDVLSFINDVLEDDRVVTGEFSIHKEKCDIAKVVQHAADITSMRYRSKKNNIYCNFPDELPNILCDPKRMGQVFNNLISNAVKYSSHGSRIYIYAEKSDESLTITVKDYGIGIQKNNIDLALRKYSSINQATESFIESYGIGLNIVDRILKGHGFILNIESYPNKGTSVIITIPKENLC